MDEPHRDTGEPKSWQKNEHRVVPFTFSLKKKKQKNKKPSQNHDLNGERGD